MHQNRGSMTTEGPFQQVYDPMLMRNQLNINSDGPLQKVYYPTEMRNQLNINSQENRCIWRELDKKKKNLTATEEIISRTSQLTRQTEQKQMKYSIFFLLK